MRSGEPVYLEVGSEVVHGGSRVVQTGSEVVHGGSKRFTAPEWFEFEAATPVNQRFKALRAAGFAVCVGGAVVLAYEGRAPTEQALGLLTCVLYVLTFDPFAALGAILARASRVILASVVCLAGIAILIPSPGLIGACIGWTIVAVWAVRRFNRRYLMQDTFASARAIPDAIRTAPESKAGLAWRHGGAKTVNGLAAELGATCKDYAEVKARELAYYIGYQTADTKITELSRKVEKLRLENTLLKDAEAEKNDLLKQIAEQDARNRKARERANTERQQLVKKIRELEAVNAELARAVPEEVQEDDTDSKLRHAYEVLHMSDREAADFAGVSRSRAMRYRKDNGIEPRGGGST